MLRTGKPEGRAQLILSVGTHRKHRPLTPLECAEKIEQEIQNGNHMAEVAKALNVSISMLGKFRKLLLLSPRVQNIVDWERRNSTISMSVGFEIARLQSHSDQDTLGELALTYKLVKTEIQHLINLKSRQGMPLKEGVKLVLDSRPRVVDVYAFFGAIIDVDMQRELANLTQQERDILFTKCLLSILGPRAEPRGRLGALQYSLTGNSILSGLVRDLVDGLDKAVDTQLKRLIDNDK